MGRAIIYARVSSDEQLKGFSIPTQLDAMRRYAEHNGIEVVETVTDDFTGTLMDRPGLNEVWEIIGSGGVDTLIVYALDRLSRDMVHSGLIRQTLDENGIALHSVNDGGLVPHEWGGNFNANIKAVIAAYELRTIRERLMRAASLETEPPHMVIGMLARAGMYRLKLLIPRRKLSG
jgi:site-specific DNA recombinase